MSGKSAKKWCCYVLALSIVFVFFLSLPFSVLGASDKELVVVSWGGKWTEAERKAFYDPFEKEEGVKVIDVTSIGAERFAKLRVQIESGNLEWDVISCDGIYNLLRNKELLEKIDYAIVNNTQNIMKGSMGEYYVGGNVDGVCLAYNKNVFPEGSHPKSWADFWNVKKYPGPRTLPNYGGGQFQPIAFALLADGVSMDNLTPFDYERAFKKLDEIKPHITVWWTSGSHYQQILRDEEVVLGPGWAGRILDLGKQGLPIGIEWNEGYGYFSVWAVAKGTKNRELAMRFLNSTLDPQRQAVFTKEMGYAPTNTKALDHLDSKKASSLASYPPNWSKMFSLDMNYIAKNLVEIQERWNKWIAK
jgi:putative spermidine/putrescine transport system substrate-binding protein